MLALLSHQKLSGLGIISEVSGKKSVLSRVSEINGIHGLDVVSTKHDGNHRPQITNASLKYDFLLGKYEIFL